LLREELEELLEPEDREDDELDGLVEELRLRELLEDRVEELEGLLE